jgi:hypothetical protein
MKHWSNTGQALVKHWSNTGQNTCQIRLAMKTASARQGFGQILAEHWSNTGQTLVKHWSNAG